ncbi:hypothetical protein CRG98_035988 [Punica granatum]|uniref:Uncharacterized protein n=1 Tax=Punica granatum TaxID=22663 RepID=A0A2I0IHX7_PUNGR|nr:hypothetical protein CRG98_035988 [Punica granatum]
MGNIRDPITLSLFSKPAFLAGFCRLRRRPKRRNGATIRLGYKRRGFCLGTRPVVRWCVVAGPIRALKKIMMEIAWSNGKLMNSYLWSLPILRPQMFPLC